MEASINRGLSNVPEEESSSRRKEVARKPSSSYLSPSSASSATSPVPPNVGSRSTRKPASIRTLGKSSNDQLTATATSSASVKRTMSASSTTTTSQVAASAGSNGSSSTHKTLKTSVSTPHVGSTSQRYRYNPRLPHDKDAEPAPSTIMYWSRAPVWGALPMRSMRGHTVTLVDSIAWLIGGCDGEGSSKELYCFNTETMQWMLQDTLGDYPLPSRAHSATLIDRKIVIIGGGLGALYYSSVHIFDTTTRRWHFPTIAQGPNPAPRRAHSAVFYNGKIWIFGGGNGLTALNDLWTLDVSAGIGTSSSKPMRWEEVQTSGPKPNPRGYHTANLIGNTMVVIGGSDSKECYTDVWSLNLDKLEWSSCVKPGQQIFKRLAHTATQVGSYIFVIGGHTSSEYVSEVLLYDLVSLQYELRPRIFLGRSPSARGYHETILADSRLFLFGGFNGYTAFDDVHILDLAAGAYLPQVTSFTMGSAA